MNKIEEYNKIVSNYKPLLEKTWKEYQNILKQERDSLMEMLEFNGNFIKFGGEDEAPKYMFVETSFQHKTLSGEHTLVLRGQGFTGIVTEYADMTYMKWDQFFEHTIYIDSLERDIKEIKIITKEEYDEAFENLLMEIKQEHYNYIKE